MEIIGIAILLFILLIPPIWKKVERNIVRLEQARAQINPSDFEPDTKTQTSPKIELKEFDYQKEIYEVLKQMRISLIIIQTLLVGSSVSLALALDKIIKALNP